MNLVGALDTPTSGTLEVEGSDLSASPRPLALSQQRHRFSSSSSSTCCRHQALKNVALPSFSMPPIRRRRVGAGAGVPPYGGDRRSRGHMPSQLSGGQQQRVAIARALVNQRGSFCDDQPGRSTPRPPKRSWRSSRFNRGGITVVLVTHDRTLPPGAPRIRLPRRQDRRRHAAIGSSASSRGADALRLNALRTVLAMLDHHRRRLGDVMVSTGNGARARVVPRSPALGHQHAHTGRVGRCGRFGRRRNRLALSPPRPAAISTQIDGSRRFPSVLRGTRR